MLTVNVGIVNAPTAEFTISNSNPNVGETVTFTDVSIPGSSGTINQWSWNFGDGTPQAQSEPNALIHYPRRRNCYFNCYRLP